VNRYRSSPAIFAWELANEPRCQGCATSVITNWARDTSAYIKSLDSSHYVLLGDEGFFNRPGSSEYPYQGGEGVDFEANLQISTLDAGVFHMYISSWGMTNDWGDKWIRSVKGCLVKQQYFISANTGISAGTTTRPAQPLENSASSRNTA
jgi:mannan endo-1,4-beta-mannosidase